MLLSFVSARAEGEKDFPFLKEDNFIQEFDCCQPVTTQSGFELVDSQHRIEEAEKFMVETSNFEICRSHTKKSVSNFISADKNLI